MKVLFICGQNVGRSQMAKAIYNSLTRSRNAEAAGVHVDHPGQTLLERKQTTVSKNFYVLDVMKAVGLDISNATRLQLSEDMPAKYDKVISMALPEKTPPWLLSAPNYVYWNVKDPRGQDYEITVRTRDEIKAKIEQLLSKGA